MINVTPIFAFVLDAIEREKRLKSYGISVQKLKERINNSLGWAG